MKNFEFNPNAEAVEQEQQVIAWFRDYPPKNAKKLLERVRQIYSQVPDFIQRSFCDTLLNPKVKDKMKTLAQFIYELDNVPQLIHQLKAEGNHGMVIYKQQFYGISLKTMPSWLNKKKTDIWTPDQEREILDQAIVQWMIENRVKHFNDKIVLFSEFGFSGVSIKMDITMDEASWEEVKDKKTTDEIKRLMAL